MTWLDRLRDSMSGTRIVRTDHEEPWSPHELCRAVRATLPPGDTLLEIHDIDGCHQGRHRLGLFEVSGTKLTPRFDVWLEAGAHPTWHNLLEAYDMPWWRGGWEAMFARRFSFAFTLDPRAPALVWSRRRLLLAESHQGWHLPDGTRLGHDDITQVEAYIHWETRHLRLHTRTGDVHTILTERVLMHPFYDGLDLLADSWWHGVLAGHIAGRAGAAYWHNEVE